MKTIADFAEKHGMNVLIIRRHARYLPPMDNEIFGGYPDRGGLTYTRIINDSKQELTHEGSVDSYNQGVWLTQNNLAPSRIYCGWDNRNWIGARKTAEAVNVLTKRNPPLEVTQSPGWTYPVYTDLLNTTDELRQFEDIAVHRYLSGAHEHHMWSETPKMFDNRTRNAADYEPADGIVLVDTNFEIITTRYFRDVLGLQLHEIPWDPKAWVPKYLGGIIYSPDRKVAREFNPDFTLVE